MTDFIIKRDGSKVKFDKTKLEKWASWASNNEVEWEPILEDAINRCPNGVTTKDFHKALIDACLDTKDFYSVRMAGRLLLGQLYKDVFGDFSNKLPIKYFYKSMVSQGLWEDLKYSDEELDYLENIVDHSKDFKYEYVTIRQCIDKYLLKDKISKKIYETPQYMFLGMAMATMKDMPKERKLKDVEKLYNYLSDLKINAPTPLMNALRTSFKGYASCCVIKSDDTAPSINAAIDAAYTFTTAQAGIGVYLDTRSVGDPVNNGRTVHSGKLPYYRYLDAAVRSSKQGCYDEETQVLTDKGFVYFKDLNKNHLIAQVYDDDQCDFVKPIQYFKYYTEEDLIKFSTAAGKTTGIDLLVTNNHRMVYKKITKRVSTCVEGFSRVSKNYIKSDNFTVISAENFTPTRETGLSKTVNVKYAEHLVNKLSNFERLLIAYQADGFTAHQGSWYSFKFKKQRKIDRLIDIVNSCKFDYKTTDNKDGSTTVKIDVTGGELIKDFSWVTLDNKSSNWCEEFLREVANWDGTLKVDTSMDAFSYTTTVKLNSDLIASVAALCGAKNSVTLTDPEGNRKEKFKNYVVFNNNSLVSGRNVLKTKESYKGFVYCVEVPTGKIVVRRNGSIVVCGNSRGGAATVYYPVLDPELSDLIKAKNIKTPDQKRVNFVDYSLQTNSFFWDKVCKKDKWMLVSRYYAPKLYELFFSADLKGFEEEYVRVLKEESIPKKIVNALDVAKEFCVTRQESGRVYPAFVDEMNRHTPFKETIYSSNLCVAPDTLLLTRKGEFRIADLEGQDVEVWNGEQWSKTTVVKTGENQEVLKVLTYNSTLICTPYHKFYLEDGSEVRAIDLAQGMKLERWVNIDGEVVEDAVMCVITHNEEPTDTFCVNEPLRHKCVFNGILTGQCEEIHLPTKGIKNSGKLYEYSEDSGEIAMCFLSAIVLERVTEEEYEDVAYYTTLMVDKTIDEMVYPYDSVRYTSTRRRNIGIGLTNLACDLATKGLSYTTKEGRDYIHKIAERHEYYLHKASLRLAKEFGVAAWIDKTKYVDGWLPIDTMKDLSFVDVDQTLHYDWETLRKEIREVGGIRNSVLSANMPVESSSQVSNTTNGLYPVRDLFIIKKSGSNTNAFFSPHYEDLATRYSYEFAYDIPTERLLEVYAIVQKFTGQGISGDTYLDLTKNKMSLKQSIKEMVYASKLGLKTLYYSNSKTEKKMEQEESDCTACKL